MELGLKSTSSVEVSLQLYLAPRLCHDLFLCYPLSDRILSSLAGTIDAFVAGAGTGGTLSGVSAYLKQQTLRSGSNKNTNSNGVHVVVADPQGSGLYNRSKFGVMFSETESEGKRRRHQVDSIVEGIGIQRQTRNLDVGWRCVDDAEKVTDDEAVRMGRWLILK